MEVSILIPFHQAEPFIERCARSVLGQDYSDLEYIFIDDACTDGSLSILEQTIEQYPLRKDSVRIIRNKSNLGLAACRNQAVESCTGVFLLWVDADDWISPEHAVQLLVDKQIETNADIVSAKAIRVYEDSQEDFIISSPSTKKDTIIGFLDHSIAWAVWGRLLRVSLYRDHGIRCLEGINYNEDFQVIPKLFYYAENVVELDTVFYYYVYGNPLSYSVFAKNDLRIRLNRWKQNLVSTQMIRDFFRDRLPEVNAINDDHITRYLLHIIRDATRLGDKSSFLEAMNELKSCDRNHTPKGDSILRFFAQFSPSLCWFLKRVQCRLIDPSFIS